MSKDPVTIVEARPLPDYRLHTPNVMYIPPVWERQFYCKLSDGTEGELWLQVHPQNTFLRVH